MKKITSFVLSVSALGMLSSCNTYIGLGKDVQSLGSGMVNTGHGKTWDGNEPAPENAPANQNVPQPQTTVPMP